MAVRACGMKLQIISLALLSLLAGCSSSGPKTRPAALDPLAARFMSKAGTERVREARKIAALMPTCPIVHYNKFWWLMFGLDESQYPDWRHPSYFITKDEVFSLLGLPDREHAFDAGGNWNYAMYRVGHNRKGDVMGLYVRSFDGHVVASFVMPTNTPASIEMRGDPVTLIRTNYME